MFNFKKIGLMGIVTIFLLVSSFIVACGAEKPIKLGFFAPITGPAAADGESCLQAAQLAVKLLNEGGGINGVPVELVYYDDAFSPPQAVSIAQKLTTKDGVVAAVSGSYSHTTRASAETYQNAKTPMISAYGVHPDITRAGDYVFRQSFVGTVQGRAAAEVATKLLDAKTVSVIHVDNDFGTVLAKSFIETAEKKDIEILSVDSFSIGEREFTPALTKIKQEDPDILFLVAYAGEGAQIILQADAIGLNCQKLGTEGVDSTMQFLKIAGEKANGLVITTNLNRDSERAEVQNFIEAFTAEYGYAPDMVGASVFDAFTVLGYVMTNYGTSPQEIQQGLYKVKDFPAVTGIIKGYNELGEVTKTVQVQKVVDGEFHYFSEITDSEVVAPPTL
ncbi:MAG: ABC transporter substrate-binding protein [Candidatus Caldatribacteriota bacterium]|nr:ABC transporter substrate-binding protein [Candidatus Caldatribacteriota bacterium]